MKEPKGFECSDFLEREGFRRIKSYEPRMGKMNKSVAKSLVMTVAVGLHIIACVCVCSEQMIQCAK